MLLWRKLVTNECFTSLNHLQHPIISHLLYVDDVMFIGEWSEINFINFAQICKCFHLASGLYVNFGKSKVLSIRFPPSEIESLEVILAF